MSELVEFIRGCLDADEQTARAATQGRWKLWGMSVMADPVGDSNLETALEVADTRDARYEKPRTFNASHIARHDPARVLAEVNAKRAILDLAEDAFAHTSTDLPKDYMRATLRLLAQPYVGEPGWRDEWGTQ